MSLADAAARLFSSVTDALTPPNASTSALGHSLVLGILTGASGRSARDVHRTTWMHDSPCVAPDADHGGPGRILLRFVLEERDREESFVVSQMLSDEQRRFGDLTFLKESGGLHLKPLHWLRYAMRNWPASTLVGKMDADTLVFPCMLLHDLESHFLAGGRGSHLYYGTHVLWHGCSRRGPPRMTCYAQGGLYVLSRHLATWVGSYGYAQRHAPIEYAFEDVTLGSWIRHFAEAHGETVEHRGEGVHGDRLARLAALGAGRFAAGPFLHLNLNSGGNASAEPVDADWCIGVYRQYGCCDSSAREGRRLRRHCAAMESQQCRLEPLRPRPVPGCQGESKSVLSRPAAAPEQSTTIKRNYKGDATVSKPVARTNALRSARSRQIA